MLKTKTSKLNRRQNGMLALEQRFMFDGAAIADAVDNAVDLQISAPSAVALSANLARAEVRAEQLVTDFLNRPDAREQLLILFKGEQSNDQVTPEWQAAVDQLLVQADQGQLNVRVELRSNAELQGAKGAFSASGTKGEATIYLNADWVATADSESVAIVLTEEMGHYLDHAINGDADTTGDEGEVFAQFLVNGTQPLPVSFDLTGNDHAILSLDEQQVLAELASFNFVNAYEMVYDRDNSTLGKNTAQITTGDIATTERWSDKEQNSHFFNASVSLGVVSITDGTNGQNFSGNDVSASTVVVGGNTYYGWISRPIKAGGVVRGFFFWTDSRFTTLALAQADGNQDGDSSVLNNRGFLFVVDQAWFNTQIAAGTANVAINNTKDGNLGSITVANVGSSSDRVDSALNSLIVPNSAPVAANDTLTVNEDSAMVTRSGANSLLSNDSDSNSDALTITSFSVGGTTTTLSSGTGTYVISGAGTITVRSDGSYDFTPAAGFSGAVAPITYTVSDGNGGSATAVLSISVTPVNDAPASTNDVRTVSPNTTIFLGLSDFGTYSDPDADPLAKIIITSLPASGVLEFFDGSAWAAVTVNQELTALAINSGQLRLTTATTDVTIGFKVSDGTLSSGGYTLGITVPAAPATPTANLDTGTGVAFEATEGVNGASGTNAAGNLLTNDTGSSIKVTAVFNTAVAASGNTSIVGKYGTLTISATGAYSYAPNNSNSVVDALNVGGSLTENFSYIITDSNGNTATSTLTVKVNGANDAPVARDDANAVKELASLTNGNYGTASGNVLTNDSDVDNSTGLKVLIESSDSIAGSGITTTASATSPINSSGTTYTVVDVGGSNWGSNNGIPTSYVNALLNGQTISVDSGGLLQVKRTGNGNTAVISFNSPETLLRYSLGTVFGADSTTSTYKLTAISTAVDNSTTLTLTSSPSQQVLVGYEVTGTDIPANTTVIAINGDTLTLSNAVQITNRTLTFTSPGGAAPTAGAGEMLKSGVHGYLRVDENGAYTYTLTSNTLNAGQTYTETFAYKTTDGAAQSNTATLRIVIDGTSASFTISAVNDSLTVPEDTQGTIANVLSNDPNTTTVTSYSWSNQSTTTAGTTLSLSGVGTLSISSGGLLTFTPAANYNGPVPSVTYTAKGAGTEEVSATVAISITSANDAPTGTNDVITIEKNTNAILTLGDFGVFSDVDGDALAGIKVTTLESAGTLSYYNGSAWVDVTLNQAISATDIAAAKLRFTPATNSVGSNYATLGFEVFDGTTYSTSSYTLTVNVIDSVAASVTASPVNTVPSAQTISSYQTLAFTGLSVNDADNDITSSTLTVANGTLAVTGAGSTGLGTANSPLVLTGNKATIDALLATLVYTPTAAFAGTDTLRIYTSDSTGKTDTDFVSITINPDTRALTVTGTVVNEASPYVYFQVAGLAGQYVQLQLGTTGSGNGHAIQGTDYLPNLQYFNGTTWVAYSGSAVAVPAGNNLLVRTGVLQDTNNEGAETLKLIAKNTSGATYEGNSTIIDDGTGSIFLGNNSFSADTGGSGFPTYLDDDRPVSVNNIAVNEASPWAMFTISGYASQVLGLTIIEGTAKVGDGSPADGSEDYSPNLQYWNGTTWTAYNGTSVTLAGTTLLVRTAIHQDTLFEGQHTFNLGVTKLSSNTTVYGSASIYDDGTGNIYAFDNDNDGTVTITSGPGAGFDDDRTLTINSPLVNEASDYVVFTLTGNSGQTVSLQLQDESINGTVSGKANILENQTLKIWDGLAWVNYDANNLPTFNANGKIFVRVNIIAEQDAPFEGGETFKLNATLTGRTIAVTGEATIVDDGTGVKFPGTFTNGLPTTNTTNLDNDQTGTISVTGGIYNEGSPRAVFTINASPGQALTLDVLDEADTGKAPTGDDEDGADDSLNNAPIYYSLDGGNTWQLYTGTSIIAGSVPVLVAVDINQESDNVYEGEEQFKLVVTSGNQSASAFGTILDDGTGKISPAITPSYSSLSDPTADLGGIKDDDRPLTVSSVTVNEGSPYAVFTVTGAANQQATLGLSGQNSDGANLSALQYFDGTTWQNYTAGATVTLNSSGTLLVRVALSPEQEIALDGPEAFNLVATNTGGAAATGVGTIVDDGTGSYFAADNNSATPAVPAGIALDDDRPKAPPLIIEPVEVAPAIPTPLTPPQIVLAPVVPNFSSALNPLRSSIVVAEPPLPLIESITSGSGYQIPVSETAPIGLTLYQGVTDQFVQSTNTATKVSLPFDAFIHSNKDAVIKLNAKQADDSPLPNWVQFDPNSGVFEVVPPAGFKGKLNLKVIARDDDGREATAIFQMFIGEQTTDRPQSRSSFSDKLKTVSNRPLTLIQVSEMHSKLQTTEGKVLKVRGV